MYFSSERSRWSLTAVRVLACWIALVSPLYVAAAPNRCIKKMLSKNWVEGEEFRDTRVSLNCEAGDIKWLSARKSHLLTFTRGGKDIVVCLSVVKSGARVYHVKGTQRRLIAGVNDTGFLNCFESECKHVSFLFEVDDNYSGPKNLFYSYSGYIDIKCAKCSETCQTDCLCSSEFVFHGKLLRSEFRINTYLHYFQVAEFVRYNGDYVSPILSHHAGLCSQEEDLETASNSSSSSSNSSLSSSTNSTTNSTTTVEVVEEESESESEDTTSLLEWIEAEIPHSGTVRVIAKCPLRPNKTYFVSARMHLAVSGRPRLLMCCQDSDERAAQDHLTQLVHRQECCRHV